MDKFISSNIKEENINWLEKYRPKKISELIGNYNNIEHIKKWLKDFKDNKPNTNPAFLIMGAPGTGKTTAAKCILEYFNYNVIEFNASDIRAQKNVKEKLNNILNNDNLTKLTNTKKKITAIIMDEVDGMIGGDRGGISELISILCPIKGRMRVRLLAQLCSVKIIMAFLK